MTHRYYRYYLYCLSAGLLLASATTSAELAAVTDTGSHAEQLSYHCENYVETSLQQNQLNITHNCGFTGARWNNNRDGQYQWCMSVRESISFSETDARRNFLEQCFTKQTARDNPENHPAVPAACLDNSGQYQAVKTIYSEFRYEKHPVSPVADGLIRYDYNRDNNDDYLFLEVNDEDMARISVCLSQPQGYQRRVSKVVFYTPGSGLEGDKYTLTQDGDQLQIELLFFGHNMGSAYTTTRYQYNSQKQNFEIVSSESDSSPVEMDGQPYPMSSPPPPDMTLQ